MRSSRGSVGSGASAPLAAPARAPTGRRFVVVPAFVLALAALSADVRASESEAVAVVESLHATLVENMVQGAATSLPDRVSRLEPVVRRAFDFPAITRIALGRNWPDLDEPTRRQLQALLTELSVLTYASRFTSRDHRERFVLRESRPGRRGRMVVRTLLERDNGDPVSLDYVLQSAGDGYRIVNVLAEGVSDLSLKRAQYAAVIRDHGVDGLLERIREQVRRLRADSDTSG